MTPIDSTLWPIEDHTIAKHRILTYHLKAWFPKLGSTFDRLLYVDGFAGPGEYRGGEPGSPVLVLEALKQHSLLPRILRPGVEVVFLFIEEREDRFTHLEHKLQAIQIPPQFKVILRHATFQDVFDEVLSNIEVQGTRLAPSFIFVDPFGPTGFPMSLMQRLAAQPQAEILVNFSYQPLNQWFLGDPTKHHRLDELYGDGRWRPALTIQGSAAKEDSLVSEYRLALEQRGWRGTQFRMINRHNQSQYYLLFGTKNPNGMLVMKRAMWSAAPDGDFQYSDMQNPLQARLFTQVNDGDYSRDLADILFRNRNGTTTPKIELLENEVAWHPTCIERHLTQALRLLENSVPPKVTEVTLPDGRRRRKGTYPDDCLLTFASVSQEILL